MKQNLQNSKKGFQLIRNLRQSTNRKVWISSSVIFLFTFGLVVYFNVSDVDKMFAASTENNRTDLSGDLNGDDPADHKPTGADKRPLNDESNNQVVKTNSISATASPANDSKETKTGEWAQTNDGSTNSENAESGDSQNRINGKLSNNELMELKIVSYGPNPFKDKLSVTFLQQVDFDVDFEIINSSGQAVFIDVINAHKGLNQYDFTDRKALPSGTYYLTLLYNHKTQVKKIIKN